jgi:hypothetical protein
LRRFTTVFLIAGNCGAKKAGVKFAADVENTGGGTPL